MTWQDLKNIARMTYEQSRDAAYQKLQDRKKERSANVLDILWLAACFGCGLAFGAFMGALSRGMIR